MFCSEFQQPTTRETFQGTRLHTNPPPQKKISTKGDSNIITSAIRLIESLSEKMCHYMRIWLYVRITEMVSSQQLAKQNRT